MTEEKTTVTENFEKGGEDFPSQEEMQALYAASFQDIVPGNIVTGTVMEIRRDDVVIDIGYKSEGMLSKSEFKDISEVKVGQDIEVYLENLEDKDGVVVLSKQKADKIRNWEKTVSLCQEGNIVEGRIYKKVKGGLMVDIGMDAFLPASQVDIKIIRDLDDYVGHTYDFKIVQINTDRKNVVVSRRELLEEARTKSRSRMLSEIVEGEVRRGVVKNITDFGAFIDISGVDGLLHLTDMSWGKISHPSEMVGIGDCLDVMILNFDKEKERVSLGLKQKSSNPWDTISKKYPVGETVKGKIVNTMPYGAFMEIEKGVEGLIHISELSWTKKINHPSEVLTVGDEVEAMVLNIEQDEKKISLGIKQTEFNPWSVVEDKYKEDMVVKGKISNITNYGAFISLENGIDGLIHLSDISWTKKINHPSEVLKKGDEVEAKILSVSKENKKISLGIKQLQENPWETVSERIQVGNVIEGVVNKVTGFGIFVDVGDDLEGLVHISQISDDDTGKDVKDIYAKGDKVKAKVVKVDIEEKKIALSIKEFSNNADVDAYKSKNSSAFTNTVLDASIMDGLKDTK